MKSKFIVWSLTAAGLIGATAILAIAEPEKAGKPAAAAEFKPVTTVEQMMEGQEILFQGVKDAIKEEKWHEGQTQAYLLAELGNVNKHQSEEADYKVFATTMSGKCVDLAKALKKRDREIAKAAVNDVSNSCKACHDKYEKKK